MIRLAIFSSAQALTSTLDLAERCSARQCPATPQLRHWTVCPTTPIPVMRQFGIDVHASLKLANTTLDLSQQVTPTRASPLPSASSSGSGSLTGMGNGQGSGTGSGTGF